MGEIEAIDQSQGGIDFIKVDSLDMYEFTLQVHDKMDEAIESQKNGELSQLLPERGGLDRVPMLFVLDFQLKFEASIRDSTSDERIRESTFHSSCIAFTYAFSYFKRDNERTAYRHPFLR